MLKELSALIRCHPLVCFFFLAYGITRLGAIPFALGTLPVPMLPVGPLVAALIVGAVSDGREAHRACCSPCCNGAWHRGGTPLRYCCP
jgi:hypothetical protein